MGNSKLKADVSAKKVEAPSARKVVKEDIKSVSSSDESSDSSDSSSDESDEEEEETEEEQDEEDDDDSSEDSSSSEDDSDSDEESVANGINGKVNGKISSVNGTKANGVKKVTHDSDSEDDDEESLSSDGEAEQVKDDKDSDDSGSDEEQSNGKKRKASPEPVIASKKSRTVEEPSNSNILFVGRLPWAVDDAQLLGLFDSFGNVTECRVVYENDTGRSKGFGYVHFETPTEARAAQEAMHGTEVDGRQINVDYAADRQPKGANQSGPPRDRAQARAKSFGDVPGNPSPTLFVGNLPFDATDGDVREHFESFGSITRCHLPTDQNDGRPKGFGYVEFSSVEEASSAYDALVGSQINGRTIRLDYAQPRSGNGGGGGRGGGGFGGGRGGGGFGGGRGGRGGYGGRDGGRDGGFGGGRGGGFRGGRGGGRGGGSRGGFNSYSGNVTTFAD